MDFDVLKWLSVLLRLKDVYRKWWIKESKKDKPKAEMIKV